MTAIHSPEYQRFLKRLKNARSESGLTQVEVANALGQPQSFVSKCESGERRVDVLELAMFASLYGKNVNDFVDSIDYASTGGESYLEAAEDSSPYGG